MVLVGYLVALRLIRDIDNRTFAALIDPIGSTALGLVTRYWSPAEKNTRLIPFSGELALEPRALARRRRRGLRLLLRAASA